MSDLFLKFDYKKGTFFDTMYEFVEHHITSLLKILAPLSINIDEFRRMYVMISIKIYYHMLKNNPDNFLKLIEKSTNLKYFVGEFTRSDTTYERIEKIVGGNFEDPLVIKL